MAKRCRSGIGGDITRAQAFLTAKGNGMSLTQAPLATFEPEFVAALKKITEEMISFNKLIGLHVIQIAPHEVRARMVMRDELVGHYMTRRIHGGAVSAALDAMGGLAVMAAIGAKHMDEPVLPRMQRFMRIGTIDLRVDFLRQGLGDAFNIRAEVLRLGSRVASTRMEFLADDGTLLSTGAAAYIVS